MRIKETYYIEKTKLRIKVSRPHPKASPFFLPQLLNLITRRYGEWGEDTKEKLQISYKRRLYLSAIKLKL
jgi:hypothetical protein